MIGVFVVLGSVIPIGLAFALLFVTEPRWMGWLLWAISAAIGIYAWLWWTGIIPSDGARIYGAVIAIWFSWAPVVALGIKTLKGRA